MAEVKVLGIDEALRGVCLRRAGIAAWGRLAPRRLYLEVPFPPGMVFEDGYITPDHIAWTDELFVLRCSLYGYVAREGSITRRDSRTLKDMEDIRAIAVHVEQVSASWNPNVRAVVPWYQAIRYRSVMWRALGLRDGRATRPLRREASTFMRANMRCLARIRRENRLAWKSLAGFLAVGYLPYLCWLVRAALDLLPAKRRRAWVNGMK